LISEKSAYQLRISIAKMQSCGSNTQILRAISRKLQKRRKLLLAKVKKDAIVSNDRIKKENYQLE